MLFVYKLIFFLSGLCSAMSLPNSALDFPTNMAAMKSLIVLMSRNTNAHN